MRLISRLLPPEALPWAALAGGAVAAAAMAAAGLRNRQMPQGQQQQMHAGPGYSNHRNHNACDGAQPLPFRRGSEASCCTTAASGMQSGVGSGGGRGGRCRGHGVRVNSHGRSGRPGGGGGGGGTGEEAVAAAAGGEGATGAGDAGGGRKKNVSLASPAARSPRTPTATSTTASALEQGLKRLSLAAADKQAQEPGVRSEAAASAPAAAGSAGGTGAEGAGAGSGGIGGGGGSGGGSSGAAGDGAMAAPNSSEEEEKIESPASVLRSRTSAEGAGPSRDKAKAEGTARSRGRTDRRAPPCVAHSPHGPHSTAGRSKTDASASPCSRHCKHGTEGGCCARAKREGGDVEASEGAEYEEGSRDEWHRGYQWQQHVGDREGEREREGECEREQERGGAKAATDSYPSYAYSNALFELDSSRVGGFPGSETFSKSSPGSPFLGVTPEASPGFTIPGSSIPGSSIPGSSIPGSSVPGSSIPGSSIPASSFPQSSFQQSPTPRPTPGTNASRPRSSDGSLCSHLSPLPSPAVGKPLASAGLSSAELGSQQQLIHRPLGAASASRAEVLRLRGQLRRRDEMIFSMQARMGMLEEERRRAEGESVNAVAAAAAAREEAGEAKGQLREREEVIVSLQARMGALEGERRRAEGEIARAEAAVAEAEAAAEAARAVERASAEAACAELQKREEVIVLLQARLVMLEGERRRLEEEGSARACGAGAAVARAEAAAAAELQKREEMIVSLQARLVMLEGERRRAEERETASAAAAAAVRGEAGAAEIEALKGRLQESEREVEESGKRADESERRAEKSERRVGESVRRAMMWEERAKEAVAALEAKAKELESAQQALDLAQQALSAALEELAVVRAAAAAAEARSERVEEKAAQEGTGKDGAAVITLAASAAAGAAATAGAGGVGAGAGAGAGGVGAAFAAATATEDSVQLTERQLEDIRALLADYRTLESALAEAREECRALAAAKEEGERAMAQALAEHAEMVEEVERMEVEIRRLRVEAKERSGADGVATVPGLWKKEGEEETGGEMVRMEGELKRLREECGALVAAKEEGERARVQALAERTEMAEQVKRMEAEIKRLRERHLEEEVREEAREQARVQAVAEHAEVVEEVERLRADIKRLEGEARGRNGADGEGTSIVPLNVAEHREMVEEVERMRAEMKRLQAELIRREAESDSGSEQRRGGQEEQRSEGTMFVVVGSGGEQMCRGGLDVAGGRRIGEEETEGKQASNVIEGAGAVGIAASAAAGTAALVTNLADTAGFPSQVAAATFTSRNSSASDTPVVTAAGVEGASDVAAAAVLAKLVAAAEQALFFQGFHVGSCSSSGGEVGVMSAGASSGAVGTVATGSITAGGSAPSAAAAAGVTEVVPAGVVPGGAGASSPLLSLLSPHEVGLLRQHAMQLRARVALRGGARSEGEAEGTGAGGEAGGMGQCGSCVSGEMGGSSDAAVGATTGVAAVTAAAEAAEAAAPAKAAEAAEAAAAAAREQQSSELFRFTAASNAISSAHPATTTTGPQRDRRPLADLLSPGREGRVLGRGGMRGSRSDARVHDRHHQHHHQHQRHYHHQQQHQHQQQRQQQQRTKQVSVRESSGRFVLVPDVNDPSKKRWQWEKTDLRSTAAAAGVAAVSDVGERMPEQCSAVVTPVPAAAAPATAAVDGNSRLRIVSCPACESGMRMAKNLNCIFCDIARGVTRPGREPTTLLYKDDSLVAFPDIKPAAYKHIQVIPIEHIATVNDLTPSEAHRQLVESMVTLGQKLVREHAPDAKEYHFGFHRPPFNSVNHLHLHCFALPFHSWFHQLNALQRATGPQRAADHQGRRWWTGRGRGGQCCVITPSLRFHPPVHLLPPSFRPRVFLPPLLFPVHYEGRLTTGEVFDSSREDNAVFTTPPFPPPPPPALPPLYPVHYEGRLTTGEVFDSSREDNAVFTFEVGKGKVIRAWDIGIKSMKVGELAELTCQSDYAYGDVGSPPEIPPGATLVFEVELMAVRPPRGSVSTAAAEKGRLDELRAEREAAAARREEEKKKREDAKAAAAARAAQLTAKVTGKGGGKGGKGKKK
ncbi:unnamed protein product [Closterium sp. Naga37s-1]|nr:unnamed protein product [Closterium sp. Naga37s-1]